MVLIYMLLAASGLLLVLALIGILLPKQHIANSSVEINADINEVWDKLNHVLKSAEWRSDVKSVEQNEAWNNHFAYTENLKQGTKISFAVIHKIEKEKIIKKIIHNKNFGGEWEIQLSGSSKKCRVQITERGEIFNPLFRLFAKYFYDTSATINIYLKDLQNSFTK